MPKNGQDQDDGKSCKGLGGYVSLSLDGVHLTATACLSALGLFQSVCTQIGRHFVAAASGLGKSAQDCCREAAQRSRSRSLVLMVISMANAFCIELELLWKLKLIATPYASPNRPSVMFCHPSGI